MPHMVNSEKIIIPPASRYLSKVNPIPPTTGKYDKKMIQKANRHRRYFLQEFRHDDKGVTEAISLSLVFLGVSSGFPSSHPISKVKMRPCALS